MCVFDKFYVLFCFIGLVGHNIKVEKHAYIQKHTDFNQYTSMVEPH